MFLVVFMVSCGIFVIYVIIQRLLITVLLQLLSYKYRDRLQVYNWTECVEVTVTTVTVTVVVIVMVMVMVIVIVIVIVLGMYQFLL